MDRWACPPSGRYQLIGRSIHANLWCCKRQIKMANWGSQLSVKRGPLKRGVLSSRVLLCVLTTHHHMELMSSSRFSGVVSVWQVWAARWRTSSWRTHSFWKPSKTSSMDLMLKLLQSYTATLLHLYTVTLVYCYTFTLLPGIKINLFSPPSRNGPESPQISPINLVYILSCYLLII